MYWFGIQMAGLGQRTKHINRPFEYQTIWNPNVKMFSIQMVGIQLPIVFHYSEMEKLGFRMFGVQIFTVMTDHASQNAYLVFGI